MSFGATEIDRRAREKLCIPPEPPSREADHTACHQQDEERRQWPDGLAREALAPQ